MRSNYFSLLVLYPLCAFSQIQQNLETIISAPEEINQNTLVRSLSNEDQTNNLSADIRRNDYPTQVIRMSRTIENQQVDCDQVNSQIDQIFVNKITRDKFSYTTYISCTYDPETHFATEFTIDSYFDPLTDEAIEFLKTYLAEYNGADFLGTKLTIESAKGLVVSLNLSVGVKKNPNNPPFIVYRDDRSNLYFKNSFEMRNKLVADISNNFNNDDPNMILPFLDKWLFNYAGQVYRAVLRDSNYVLIQPERIFLMNSGEDLFVSRIKYYYARNCEKYEHHHCLK